MSDRSGNALRYSESSQRGHVESYFLRANHPHRPLAIWIKATVLAPRPRSAVAEAWCVVFHGEKKRIFATKRTIPVSHATFSGDPPTIRLADVLLELGDPGRTEGSLWGDGGPCTWNLAWRRDQGQIGDPLCLLPYPSMVDGPFPKNKLLTPAPLLRFSGWIDIFGERIAVERWPGMQGHNWGESHAWEYAWGQCHFHDAKGEPFCMAEGFTGRVRLGRLVTPRLSALVVRRGQKEYRFDRTFDFWRQDAELDSSRWRVHLHGPAGEAILHMEAPVESTTCLGYYNPDGRLSYCLNSKLARVQLRVNPWNEEGFECTSEHGGALEFLRNEPDPRFDRVV